MPRLKKIYSTREEWLTAAVKLCHHTVFAACHVGRLPKFRVSCSFPGGGAARKRIGECWNPASSADGTTEMFINPTLDKVLEPCGVLATLVHEMVHMYVGVEAGHGPAFRKVALEVGLAGKMTATHASPELVKRLKDEVLVKLGVYPHAKMSLAGRKKKQTYLVKVSCDDAECGAVFRITSKYIDAAEGELTCPCCQGPTTVEVK